MKTGGIVMLILLAKKGASVRAQSTSPVGRIEMEDAGVWGERVMLHSVVCALMGGWCGISGARLRHGSGRGGAAVLLGGWSRWAMQSKRESLVSTRGSGVTKWCCNVVLRIRHEREAVSMPDSTHAAWKASVGVGSGSQLS